VVFCNVTAKPASGPLGAVNKLAPYREVLVSHRYLDEQIGRIKMRGYDFLSFLSFVWRDNPNDCVDPAMRVNAGCTGG